MRKRDKIILAVLGGVDIVFYIFSPIILGAVWINLFGLSLSAYFLFGISLLSSMFRAIKIGFLKNG